MKDTGTVLRKDNSIVIAYDGGGEVYLRRPTVKELNEFNKAAYPTSKKGYRDKDADSIVERIKFFDVLFEKMTGFLEEEDADGNKASIPEDSKDRLPIDDKAWVIAKFIETKDLDLKN